ncbi:asparaginase [Marisediminicola antarctica]|uniref:Asparaginase n=1 Tax=Marisediminicola antarctica TaxID=674079 RepID=A0A7L5AP66_9MICO|nr:asparaginase [Marisediminicola antarctica]
MLTRRPLDLDGSVELAVLERAGLIESRHIGAAVVVAPDGSVLRELGDSSAEIYARSSLKLLQAVAVLRSGATLDGERAVLATASHAGTDGHVRVVSEILALAGLTEDDLRCPADWPLDREAAYSARRRGDGKRRITMNCSGKHASFLLACVVNDWPTASYLDPSHPLQQLVRTTIEELTGEGVGTVGIDGCGAPVFGTSLRGLASAVGRISGAARAGGDPLAARLAAAILVDGWAIDGPGRATTVVIERLGLVAKNGAEGVMVLGAPDGTAVAVKALDGSNRATTLVALELLVSVGALDRALADAVIADTTERVLGGGVAVGELRASLSLFSVSGALPLRGGC